MKRAQSERVMTAYPYTGFEQVVLVSPTLHAQPTEEAKARVERRRIEYQAHQRARRRLDATAHEYNPADVAQVRRTYWRHSVGLDGNGHGQLTYQPEDTL